MIYYLSFADASLPEGQQWLGACIVEASSKVEAVKEAWRRGINPGGEIAMVEPDEAAIKALKSAPADWMNKLLNLQEVEVMDEMLGALR